MKKLITKFRLLHNEITVARLKRIKKSDAETISSFYHPNFSDDLIESIKIREKLIKGFKNEGFKLKKSNKYPNKMKERVKIMRCELKSLDEEIERQKYNIKIILRNLNPLRRLSLFFKRV